MYYSKLLKYIEIEARKKGCLAVVCTTEIDPEREKEYVLQLLRRNVVGFIFCWYRGVSEYIVIKTCIKETMEPKNNTSS